MHININIRAHKHKEYKYKYALQMFYRHEQNKIARLCAMKPIYSVFLPSLWFFLGGRNFPCGLWENALWIALGLLLQHESLQNCSWYGKHSTCTWFLWSPGQVYSIRFWQCLLLLPAETWLLEHILLSVRHLTLNNSFQCHHTLLRFTHQITG